MLFGLEQCGGLFLSAHAKTLSLPLLFPFAFGLMGPCCKCSVHCRLYSSTGHDTLDPVLLFISSVHHSVTVGPLKSQTSCGSRFPLHFHPISHRSRALSISAINCCQLINKSMSGMVAGYISVCVRV